MRKLVVTYEVGDSYTYSYLHTVCIEYESEEALLCDLEEHIKKYKACACFAEQRKIEEFKSSGMHATDFMWDGKITLPEIKTLERWWEEEVWRG